MHASIFWQVIICRCKIIQVGLILFGFLVVPGSTLTYQIVFLGHLGSSLDDKLTMHTLSVVFSLQDVRPLLMDGFSIKYRQIIETNKHRQIIDILSTHYCK